jgi:hypothetical protein
MQYQSHYQSNITSYIFTLQAQIVYAHTHHTHTLELCDEDRGIGVPNWNKHSLRQRIELMGVADPECALAPKGLDRLNPKLVKKNIGAMGTSYGGRRARIAQSGRRSRPARERARSARVQGWNRAQQLPRARSSSVGRALQNKIVAYSQTDTGARTSDPAQTNLCPTPD